MIDASSPLVFVLVGSLVLGCAVSGYLLSRRRALSRGKPDVEQTVAVRILFYVGVLIVFGIIAFSPNAGATGHTVWLFGLLPLTVLISATDLVLTRGLKRAQAQGGNGPTPNDSYDQAARRVP